MRKYAQEKYGCLKIMRIKIDSINFGYKKDETVLNNISYSFNSGNIYILKGANGSGKTTLSMLLLGLIKPRSGEIRIDNFSIKKMRPAMIASKIGYLFQNTDMQLFANSVYEELAFPYIINNSLEQNTNHIKKVLEDFNLTALKDSFPLLLSGGEKQRLALATIFIRNVDFLILDEPSASIDGEGKQYLARKIKDFAASGGGVILITHDKTLMAMMDNPINLTLEGGKIYED